jgi:hypothetical protein
MRATTALPPGTRRRFCGELDFGLSLASMAVHGDSRGWRGAGTAGAGVARRDAGRFRGLTSVLGAVLGYLFLPLMRGIGPYMLALPASGFLHVALADLAPSQRGRTSLPLTIIDMLLVGAGIGVIALFAHDR